MDDNEQSNAGIPIRSVSRAFQVLQIINQLGNPTIMEVKEASKLPYPTVFRMIMTLQHDGLIECEPSRKRYRPTELVWSLVTGFQQEDLLVARSREHLVRLTSELHWPVALSVRVGDRMIIKDSTHTLTTQTFNNYYPGYMLPILDSAAGKCFVAFCPDEERRNIFASIEKYGDENSHWWLNIVNNDDYLGTIRQQGFATHARSAPTSGGRTAAIAVPIMIKDSVKACLVLVFFHSAMDMARAAESFYEPLRRTADDITASLK